MIGVLSVALRFLGILLYRLGLARAVIRWRGDRVRVLLYHACDEHESDYTAGLRSNTTPAEFARHLDFYAKYYAVIGLEQVVRGDIPDRAAVITFDDGYRSVYDSARPLLAQRGMTATFFLITNVVDNHAMVWVNELNWLLRHHPDIARPVVAAMAQMETNSAAPDLLYAVRTRTTPDEIRDALDGIRRTAGLDARRIASDARLYVTWEQVGEMQRAGFTFGNHTTMHPSLPRLSAAEQQDVMAQAKPPLADHACHADWIAYPFGDLDAHTLGAALAAGCSLMAEVGVVHGRFDPLHVGRIPVSASTDAELFAQIEVLEPAKAWVRAITGRQ